MQEKLEDVKIGVNIANYKLVDINSYSKKELLEDNLFTSKMMLIEKTDTKEDLEYYLEQIIQRIEEKDKKIMIQIIDVILKHEIGEQKSKELISKLNGGEGNMLACLEMLEKEERRKTRQAKLNEKRAEKRGLQQGISQVAKKLLARKFSIEDIMDVTGLSKDELEKIS